MRTYQIKQKRQENGLWGTPINCIKIDYLPLDSRKYMLHSAAIALIDQIWNCKFEIFNSTDNTFLIQLYGEKHRLVSFLYKNYELVDDVIYEFENEQEHTIFLRKNKIKQLELL